MSRTRITLTAPNGATVRTTHSRRYFVVNHYEVDSTYDRKRAEYVHHEPRPVAHVSRRTDSAVSAYAMWKKSPHSSTVFAVSGDASIKTALSSEELQSRVADEKATAAFRLRNSNQGEARRLAY